MELTPAMLAFLRERKAKRRSFDDALDAFAEHFDDYDKDAVKEAWNAMKVDVEPAPAPRHTPARGGPGHARAGVPGNQPAQQALNPAPTAPFRFLPLNERVALPEAAIRAAWQAGRLHDVPLADGYCGRITVTISFDGPVLVGQPETAGNNASGPLMVGRDYVIPGATLRGLTRATLEAAAFARLSQTNLHRRFGIRDFSHDLFKDEARKAVRAGWLRPARPEDNTDCCHVIEPCDWYRVRIRDLKGAASDTAEWHHAWLGKDLASRYAEFGMRNHNLFDFDHTIGFIAAGEQADKLRVRLGEEGSRGVLVFSDKVPAFSDNGLTAQELADLSRAKSDLRQARSDKNRTAQLDAQSRIKDLQIAALAAQHSAPPKQENTKRTEAVFAAAGDGTVLPVPKAVWETFVANNSRPSRHDPKPAGNWAVLKPTLDAKGRIPVFWVADGGGQVADFGLVRVFKRAHSARVMDVLANTGGGVHRVDVDAPDFCPDFVEALFGHVHEPEDGNLSGAAQHGRRHLKSRVAFGFARLAQGSRAALSRAVTTVQAAPKPSYAPFYLAGAGRKDWSQPGMQLAGRKIYPPRDADAAQVDEWLRNVPGNDNADTQSTLTFLVPAKGAGKLTFTADIRVHSVTAAELGGLIWALTLGGNDRLRHMIGRAKTAGAGQAQIAVTGLAVTRPNGAATDTTAALKAFSDHMGREVPGWATTAPVKALLRAADPATWRDARLGYMALADHAKLRQQAYKGAGPARILGVPGT